MMDKTAVSMTFSAVTKNNFLNFMVFEVRDFWILDALFSHT